MKDKILINNAIHSLKLKIDGLNSRELNISDHTREYLMKYKKGYPYFMSAYFQLLLKALGKIDDPVSECVFVDYGGGCGMLSLLAKLTGFRTVIFNDICERTLSDARTISAKLDIPVDLYIRGDAEDFVNEIQRLNIQPDLICSFDVIEHIYNLEAWIRTISGISRFSLLFMTGANPKNPVISNKLRRLHIRDEYHGCEKNIKYNDVFLNTSFLKQRGTIIREMFPELNDGDVEFLSVNSRGLRKEDIEKMVRKYIENGVTGYRIDHPTNTCDPYTGSWVERLIDLEQLIMFCKSIGLNIEITSSFYNYSSGILLNTAKFFLNRLIKILGTKSLLFSPAITVEIQKQEYV